MSLWKELFEERTHSLLCYPERSDDFTSGWIGGSAPAYFDNKREHDTVADGDYRFYMALVMPAEVTAGLKREGQAGDMLSVFVPVDEDTHFENNIYPACAVRVIRHPHSPPSLSARYAHPDLERHALSAPIRMADEEAREQAFLVKIGGTPRLIQDEKHYTSVLLEEGYDFFIQVDEDGYADGLAEEYVFGYGALFLYCGFDKGGGKEAVAGFWQFS